MAKKVHTWTDEYFTSLYRYPLNEAESTGSKVKRIKDDVKSKLNESTAVITKDGNTMYFTRNNYLKRRGYDAEKTTKLKIYKAEQKNGEWTNITELPFNSDNFKQNTRQTEDLSLLL